MIQWEYGIELQAKGMELTRQAVLEDTYCAKLIARVLAVAQIEGFFNLPDTEEAGADDTPLVERIDALANAEEPTALIHDSEVPAVLGMFRVALDRIDGNEGNSMLYSALPKNAMGLLIESFEGYELQPSEPV